MKWSDAVITNDGIAMQKESLAGKKLTITKAAGGTGTVSPASLLAQTDLTNKKQEFSLVGLLDTENGKQLKIQITNKGLANGYTLNQVGVWAALENGESKLFAILQDDDGIDIPSAADLPEFLLEFYALIQYSQYANIEVNVDPSASVSLVTLSEYMEQKEGTIKTSKTTTGISDTDYVVLSISDETKRILYSDFKAAMKRYFDTVYITEHQDISTKADLVNGKVPTSQIPTLNYVPTSQKGAASGVATLGTDKKIPVAQIPSLSYVPPTRKVNGKALNTDIYLSPNDVGVTAKRTCDLVIGTSAGGWTEADCDYLCDGVNDQIEINQALAAIPAFNGVRKIVFLQGWYNISGSISPLANVMLVGEANCADQYGSKPQLNFSNGSKLIISNSGAVGIKHLGIGQGDADSIISASQDTSDNGSPNCEFVDCYGNFHGKFPDGRFINCHGKLDISYSDSAIIRSCYFTYLSVSNCNNISIIGCGGFGSNPRPNIWLENISHAVIIGNLVHNIDLRYSSENVVVGNRITVNDNSYSSFGYYGIHMLEANRNEISGNSVLLDTGASASTHDTICLDSSNNNLVTDNLILGKNYSVTGGSGNTFVNNKYD